jgi:hypothetical protein
MSVQTAFVPVNSRRDCERKTAVRYGKPLRLAPSEGRGHRFESCRVRQSSQRVTTNFVRSRKWFVRASVSATVGCCSIVRGVFAL